MEKKSHTLEWRVGAITVGAIVILVAGILWGKGVTESIDRSAVTILFDDASGVTTSTPIYLNGVPVGTVTSLATDEDGAIVSARIDSDVSLDDDARAVVRVKELTGGKKIELDPGSSGRSLGTASIIGRNEGDIGELIAIAAHLAKDIGPLMRRADSLLGSLQRFVDDPVLQQGVRTTVTEFAELGGRANRLVTETGPGITVTIASLRELSGRLNDFIVRNEKGVESAIESTGRLTTNAGSAVEDARTSLRKLDSFLDRLNSITDELSEGEGLVATLLNDPAFTRDLQETIRTVRFLLTNIDRRGVNVNVELGHEND